VNAIGLKTSIYPTGNALALSINLGILIPILASIIPIKAAL
jgi:hypothetical protein